MRIQILHDTFKSFNYRAFLEYLFRCLYPLEMEEIPAFRYSAASKDSSNGSCVVCMMNYSNKEKLRRLPCNHDFHAKCIDKWLKVNLIKCKYGTC